ncbi:MAG: translation initiation factor IF-2 [bacterium]|nr:translation initiation factor IF-2 [bacterium]
MSDRLRVHTLAKQLNVSSKVVIEKCRAEGLEIKNHMSTLSAGLEATVREWFSEGEHLGAIETTARVDLTKVRIRRKRRQPAPIPETVPPSTETPPESTVEEEASEGMPPAPVPDEVAAGDEATTAVAEAPVEDGGVPPAVTPDEPALAVSEPAAEAPPAEVPAAQEESEKAAAVPPVDETPTPAPADEPDEPDEPAEAVQPAGPQNVPAPAKLAGPRVVRYEPVEADVAFRPHRTSSPRRRPAAEMPSPTGPPPQEGAGRRRGRGRAPETRGAGARRRPGQRGSEAGGRSQEWRDRDMAELKERLSGATGRRIQSHRLEAKSPGGGHGGGAMGPITKAEVSEPIMVREFCKAIGVPFVRLAGVFRREHDMLPNINSTLTKEVAELVALDFGIELSVKEAKTSLHVLMDEFAAHERTSLQPRPPVITMLGHVDHGKTSLLDAIRRTGVVGEEDGGITQHLGSYHLVREGSAVTFLDTPGHAAFTAMRARGAQMTDIVVLVVAADDGVMAQTVEAINHAKAAEVSIVVALNKSDLGDANENMILGQLAAHELNPSQWGGEIDVIKTSAVTGDGVEELVQHLAALAEVLELKADPTVPATGTVIEAQTKEGVGPVATVLVQEGTLRVGAGVVCGGAFGKVRALVDDSGRRIKQATPSIPVEVWGLDDVPEAGDKMFKVDSLQRAGQIASDTKQRRVVKGRAASTKARTLDDLFKQRAAGSVPELNLIIKTDVSGSSIALRKVLEEIPSDEVSLSIRHIGVGGITDGDVLLADACDGIIIGFRVVPSLGARHLAEEKGVDVRRYKVIYEVTDDIRRAMEGLLEPEKRIEQRATVEVRDTFRITKVGMVAGGYVTDGVVNRNHFARLIRDGVVIRDDCKLSSLRRFKDDVREVRAGMECGIRLESFEDVKPGDIVESYEIVKVPRKLKGP